MMDFFSYKSGAAFAPPHPKTFHLVGFPLPLAGLNDTYWIARAIWMDGDDSDEGFLIYADQAHYLFLDDAEARTASLLIGAFQPELRKTRAIWQKTAQSISQRLQVLTALQERIFAGLARLPLFLLTLPALTRLILILGSVLPGLGLAILPVPTPSLGAVLLLPVALASWCFGWRGSFWVGGLIVITGLGSFLLPGHAAWGFPWLVSFMLNSLSTIVVGLFIATLRQITDRLLVHIADGDCAQQAGWMAMLAQRTSRLPLYLGHEASTPLQFQRWRREQERRADYFMMDYPIRAERSEVSDTSHHSGLIRTSVLTRETGEQNQVEALASD